MPEQIDIFGGVSDPADLELGRSQRAILDALRSSPDGLYDDDVGAILHHRRGRHPIDERCGWCGEDGLQVLGSLSSRDRVVRAPDGRWRAPRQPGQQAPAQPVGEGFEPLGSDG